jgi:hypothetical protein
MSVPWKHVSLAACLGQLSLSLFLWSTTHRELWDTWQHPELPSQEGRAPNCGTHGSTGAHLVNEARTGAEGYVAAPELSSARR